MNGAAAAGSAGPDGLRLRPLAAAGPGEPKAARPALVEARITAHGPLAPEYLRLELEAPAIAAAAAPGQFAMLTLAAEGEAAPVLPRPMALYGWDADAGRIEIVYRIVGDGTRRLARWPVGARLVVVGPLGRGFALPPGARRIALLGRGIGTCSLTALAAAAAARGVAVHALVSARQPAALVGRAAYEAAGVAGILEVVDSDGTSGMGPVGAWLADRATAGLDQLYVCGSERLLDVAAAAGRACGAGVQVSLEAHMACGIGFCHGCAGGHPGLADESPLVCRDGPVFALADPGT